MALAPATLARLAGAEGMIGLAAALVELELL